MLYERDSFTSISWRNNGKGGYVCLEPMGEPKLSQENTDVAFIDMELMEKAGWHCHQDENLLTF